jgi:hypothetical protein
MRTETWLTDLQPEFRTALPVAERQGVVLPPTSVG